MKKNLKNILANSHEPVLNLEQTLVGSKEVTNE